MTEGLVPVLGPLRRKHKVVLAAVSDPRVDELVAGRADVGEVYAAAAAETDRSAAPAPSVRSGTWASPWSSPPRPLRPRPRRPLPHPEEDRPAVARLASRATARHVEGRSSRRTRLAAVLRPTRSAQPRGLT